MAVYYLLWQLWLFSKLFDSMKPASLSVLVLVPLAMTKFPRKSVCSPFQNYELCFFFIKNQVFKEFVVLLNRKSEGVYMLTKL